MGPVAGDGIQRVGDSKHASAERNLVPGQSVRVAGPVPPLMGAAHHPPDARQRAADLPEHLIAGTDYVGKTIADQLAAKRMSWKSYQESIPVGGVDTVNFSDGFFSNNTDFTKILPALNPPLTQDGIVALYAAKHNPFVFFDDVTNTNDPASAYCIAHVRPYTELATDLTNNTVASYNFITPNLCDDGHDSCSPLSDPVAQTDTWLSQNLPAIINSTAYKAGGVAIFITWDEGEGGDGPIGMIVLSPNAKVGYQNTIHYDHSSTLRTMEEIFHVTPLLGGAASATDLSDLFVSFP